MILNFSSPLWRSGVQTLFCIAGAFSARALTITEPSHDLREVFPRQTKQDTFIGCVADGGPRVLRHQATSNNSAADYHYCTDQCFAAGYALAGVEFGHECFCGNAILYDYGSGTCDTPCPGDPTNTCGGSLALQLYSTGAGPYTTGPALFVLFYKGYTITECWEDNNGGRALPHTPSQNPPAASMTVEKCIDACAASNYNTAGLEWGQECWCDNAQFPIGESTVAEECQRPCNGNAGEWCGDANRILVYTSLPWEIDPVFENLNNGV